MRHIAFMCPLCLKERRTWPMFAASVDRPRTQSQGSIHQCCHDPHPDTDGRMRQPMDIKHQLHQFARDLNGGVHSIYRVADRILAAVGAGSMLEKGDAGMAFEQPVNSAELLLSDGQSLTVRHKAPCRGSPPYTHHYPCLAGQ